MTCLRGVVVEKDWRGAVQCRSEVYTGGRSRGAEALKCVLMVYSTVCTWRSC